jgi:DNA-binding response OmpR family regulator
VSAVARSYDSQSHAHPARSDEAGLSLPKILIIDDSEVTANALAALLRRENYTTAVASRGSAGIDLARSAHSAGNGRGGGNCGFAAAVVDIHLPDLSGLVVSQKLREILGPDTPIIVLSGDTSMPHVGATYFFSKPVNAGYLLERLRAWAGTVETEERLEDRR